VVWTFAVGGDAVDRRDAECRSVRVGRATPAADFEHLPREHASSDGHTVVVARGRFDAT
jgi:hypothetical protein